MSTPEDEQAEGHFEHWNEGTEDHVDITDLDDEELNALLREHHQTRFKTPERQLRASREYYRRKHHLGEHKCPWCGQYVKAPNEYHDECLEVKNKLRRNDGRD